MFDTFAHYVSDVHQALGHPDREHLDGEDVVRAVMMALAAYGLSAQQSEYSRVMRHAPLNLNSRDSQVNLPAMMLPSFIERRSGNVPNEFWDWVPIVRPSLLEEARGDGLGRASFYTDEQSKVHLRLSYDPAGTTHRIWYYSDPVIVAEMQQPSPLPVRFAYMIVHKAVINAVPMMMARSAKLPEEQQLNSAILQALLVVTGHADNELKTTWEPMWAIEKNADKNPHGRMRTSLLAGSGGYRGGPRSY